MDFDFSLLETINQIPWGPWTPYILLAAGLLMTIWDSFGLHTGAKECAAPQVAVFGRRSR